MASYDERMKDKLPENQKIYNAWIVDCKNKGAERASLAVYESQVVSFLDTFNDLSILDIREENVKAFITDSSVKPSQMKNRYNFLKKFLEFVNTFANQPEGTGDLEA